MAFERTSFGTGIGADPAPTAGPAEHTSAGGATSAMRLQILATEHWSLLASRSLAWNESFSRAGMFLSTLSGAIVALALVAQASAFGDGFTLFALVILPVVFFVGVTTFIRLGASNYHDALCVIGMNRIRAAYLELAPDLERFFVMSAHDDPRGVGISMGVPYGGGLPLVHLIAATPMVVATLNCVVAGTIAAVAALRSGAVGPAALPIGALGFVLALVGHMIYARSNIKRVQGGYHPLFPTPDPK
ncbi:MAG: hypothetical protein M3P16_01835 [Chloroflexota bacterium]|nr:hypothetical protein [Chloroflexota bacterium]